MARPTRRARPAPPSSGGDEESLKPGVLITFDPETPNAAKNAAKALADSAGVQGIAFASDFKEGVDAAQTAGAGATVFEALGVAVADADPDQQVSLSSLTSGGGPVLAVEAEPIFFAFADGLPQDFAPYLRGYRDAVNNLYDKAFGDTEAATTEFGAQAEFQDSAQATWGLVATKVINSSYSGRGVRVAVLDTGMDLDHPDFETRRVVSQSFITNQAVQDDNGHGTHCIGTSCGAKSPSQGRRYGIAHEAEIYAGKVLSNRGSSLGRSTLAGIEWAVRNRCAVISMSLGGRVQPGQSYLLAFETVARAALRAGSLIVAAAGNDSRRSQGQIAPVSTPANCPSILSVAALDNRLRVADFSNSGINVDAQVDIAAPGVQVYSSAPEPAAPPQPPFFRQWKAQYDTINGTSMATPHVAGIAALLKEQHPALTANELWRMLTSKAISLSISAKDIGAGLAQA